MFEFKTAVLFGLIFGTPFVITGLLLPGLLKLILEAGFSKPNYRGEPIPVGAGLVFFLACLPVGAALLIVLPSLSRQVPLFLLGIAGMTMVGLFDDIFGNRLATGLRGHFSRLCQAGKITTGTIKAMVGGMLGLVIALAGYSAGGTVMIILQTLTIALSVNAVNLLDLRPGRAGKGFVLAAAILLILNRSWYFHLEIVFLLMMLGSLLAYLPRDLHAQAMMGDAGSNALGITLGMVCSWVLPEQGLVMYIVLLLIFHIWAEKYSLTEYIEKVPLLSFLDKLGRQ